MKRRTLLTRAGLAAKLGLSEERVKQMVKQGAPQEPDGRFCLEAVQQWRAAHVRQDLAKNPELLKWRGRLLRAQARQEELELRKARDELIDVDEVARFSERRIATTKALLEQIPDRLAGLLPRTMKSTARRDFRARAAEMIEDALFALTEAAEDGYPNGATNETPAA